jgi:hypothetical protein
VPLESFDPRIHLLNALGAVIKNSDLQRAKTLVHIEITDEASLILASLALVAMGQPKIKVRITIDCTGSGLNEAAYCPSFRQPGFCQALLRVERDRWLAKADISRYFHSFPISKSFSNLLVVEFDAGEYSQYIKAPMGFGPCPYYASTWSAEIRQWMISAGLDPAFLMDDWFETGVDEADARSRMSRLSDILIRAGYDMAVDKFGFGQLMVFLGILIDTTTMTCRIDKTQAGGFKQQLLAYVALIESGRDVDLQTVRHVAGKLSWYCEVLQSGRMHINQWWRYASVLEGWTRYYDRRLLLDETAWWLNILEQWERDESSVQASVIFNSSEILANPDCFQIVQSDASGKDGCGYVFASYRELNYSYYSKIWPGVPPEQSHEAELLALEAYFLRDSKPKTLVLWITDSQSAAWTVNKGNCDDPIGRPILARILGMCDAAMCQLFAMWVPRELNELTDHLSHLSHIMDRDEIAGRRLEVTARSGAETSRTAES